MIFNILALMLPGIVLGVFIGLGLCNIMIEKENKLQAERRNKIYLNDKRDNVIRYNPSVGKPNDKINHIA